MNSSDSSNDLPGSSEIVRAVDGRSNDNDKNESLETPLTVEAHDGPTRRQPGDEVNIKPLQVRPVPAPRLEDLLFKVNKEEEEEEEVVMCEDNPLTTNSDVENVQTQVNDNSKPTVDSVVIKEEEKVVTKLLHSPASDELAEEEDTVSQNIAVADQSGSEEPPRPPPKISLVEQEPIASIDVPKIEVVKPSSDKAELVKDQENKKNYPTDFNPFGDEEEEEATNPGKPYYPVDLNPFGEDEATPTVVSSKKSNAKVYDDSLNPFGDDEETSDGQNSRPVPAPRRLRQASKSPSNSPMPGDRKIINGSNGSLNRSDNLLQSPAAHLPASALATNGHPATMDSPDANDNCISAGFPRSSTPQPRNRLLKKKVAPKPPTPLKPATVSSTSVSLQQTPTSIDQSVSSDTVSHDTSFLTTDSANTSLVSSMPESPASVRSTSARRPSLTPSSVSGRSDASVSSDTTSHSKEFNNSTLSRNSCSTLAADSLTKKKRQAPAPPQAARRTVYGSVETIQVELMEIGDRLAEIQIHVQHLEDAFQNNQSVAQAELILNYLEFARETCLLARKQEELMYQKREHKLEEEHADIEYQIRLIELKAPFKRTVEDDTKAQELLMRLIEVIDERNDVVENMTKINKRPEFDKRVGKLVTLKSQEEVTPVLEEFLRKYDMKVIETKIIKDTSREGDEKAIKKEKKKKEKKEKKEAKLKEKKDKKEQSKQQDDHKDKDHSKSKSPMNTLKKFGTLKLNKEPKMSTKV